MQLPEHVTLCDQCGCAPAHDMTIPKWVFMEVGDCWCEPTEDADADAQPEMTFAHNRIGIEDLGAIDIKEEAYSTVLSPHRDPDTGQQEEIPAYLEGEAEAYRITIYNARGEPYPEAAQALWSETKGFLMIAWGADGTSAYVDALDAGIELWLNDPDGWEAGN